MFNLLFFTNSIMLGVGMAMDAFSVSLANGLNEPKMKAPKICLIAGTFAFFQFFMPTLGYFLVSTVAEYFKVVEPYIPAVALILLCLIGRKMIKEGRECNKSCPIDGNCDCAKPVTLASLFVQGVATSIDALSVGFTISTYTWAEALICSLIIAVVTFIICICGIFIGRKMGTKLQGKASIFGGVILILIGLEIFITGLF